MTDHRRSLLRLAGPNYIGLLSGVVAGIIDVAWVARLGAPAAAAVAVATNVENLLLGVILAVSGGLTIVLAARSGAGDAAGSRAAIRAGWILFAVITPVVSAAGLLLREPIAALFVGDPAAIRLTTAYFAVAMPTVALFYGQWMIGAIFSGRGDTRTPMRLALLSNAVLLVLDPLLIYGLAGLPRLGVVGAAVATAFGRLVALLAGLVLLRRRQVRGASAPASGQVRAVLAAGVPMAGEFLVRMAGALGTVAVVGRFGVVAVAAYGIGMKALYVATMAFYAIRNAATIHAPRVLAAADAAARPAYERDIARSTLRLALATGVLAAAVFAAFAEPVMQAFTGDAAVVAAGAGFLRWVGPYLVALAGVVALGGVLMGSGRGPLLLAVTVVGTAGQLTLAWVLADRLGIEGVWLAMGLAAAGQLAALTVWGRPRRSGRWLRLPVYARVRTQRR